MLADVVTVRAMSAAPPSLSQHAQHAARETWALPAVLYPSVSTTEETLPCFSFCVYQQVMFCMNESMLRLCSASFLHCVHLTFPELNTCGDTLV